MNLSFVQGSNLSIVGTTMHVKITTTDIGLADRAMYAIRSTAVCSAATPAANVNVVASDLLYESPTGLSQGRLAGLGYGASSGNRCVAFNLSGASFIDGGGTGGTYRGDIVGDPFVLGMLRYEPTVNGAGSKVIRVVNPNGLGLTTGSGALFQTTNSQSGIATFASSNTVTVTLPVALPDTNYRIAVSANAQETISVSSRTTTAFTLQSSNAASTASVDWIV